MKLKFVKRLVMLYLADGQATSTFCLSRKDKERKPAHFIAAQNFLYAEEF